MLSSIVMPGDKVEVMKATAAEKNEKNPKKEKIKPYFSKIYDIMDEDKLKIAMPTQGTKLVALSMNQQFDLCIFTKKGLYICRAVLTERYKEEGLYVAVMDLVTGLQKYQRRQHYRLECNLDVKYRVLADQEAEMMFQDNVPESFQNKIVSKGQMKGLTLDISGGGIRFVSGNAGTDGNYLLIDFDVMIGGEPRHFSIVSSIVESKMLENRGEDYEYRVKFESITKREREDLIKYIFEQERRLRKNEKG